MSKRIVISSGHGKLVAGANGVINEVTEARKVVSRVVSYLKSAGVDVVEFHEDKAATASANVNNIVAFHNSQTRDLDVSVHFNSAEGGIRDTAMGVEVLYYSEAALAAKVSQAIAAASGLKNRGAKQRTDLGFLSRTAKPAILIEVCFVVSRADVEHYQAHFDAICRAIAETISGVQIPAQQTGTQAGSFSGLSASAAAEKILELVRPNAEQSGLFPSVKAAQMLLESAYATSELAKNANNCFGMKTSLSGNTWPGSTWDGVSIYRKETLENRPDRTPYTVVADFRKYACMEDSIADHSAYLLGAKNGSILRYAGITEAADCRAQLEMIKAGGYATDVNYVAKLCEVIEKFKLDRYDRKLELDTITVAIGSERTTVPAENIGGNWYITMPDGVRVKIRDVLTALGYPNITWESSSRTIVAAR